MNHFDIARKLLLVHEGLKLTEYKCTAGHRTIGVGFNLDANRLPSSIKPTISGGKLSITKDEAMRLLDSSMLQHWDSLVNAFPWVDNLDDVRKAAMLDLAFNMGVGSLKKFVNTLSYLSVGKYVQASKNLTQSKWAEQVQKQRVDTITELIMLGVISEKIKQDYGI